MELRSKQIVVVGMANSGMAAARFLKSRGGRVTLTDQRAASELRPEISQMLEIGVAIETGGHRDRTFLNADLIVASPGVPFDIPLLVRARSAQIPVIGEIELAARFLKGTVVAITGANGKTTTTSLAGELFSACGRQVQVGGNIGTPLISLAESSTPDTVNVVEVSSFQLETTERFHAHAAAVLNLSPDHLDRHGSMEAYAAAKQRIFRNQTTSDYAVLNLADTWCRRFATAVASQVRWFSSEDQELPGNMRGAYTWKGGLYWREGEESIEVLRLGDIPLRGRHNVENVLAAVALACIVQEAGQKENAMEDAGDHTGIRGLAACSRIREAVRQFKAVEHRLEYVAKVNGVEYFNDSKATNVDATTKALEAFEGGLWVILGGKDKNSDYTVLTPMLKQRARGVLLIGAAADKIATHLAGSVELIRSGTLEQAVLTAAARAQPGDTVLLAPACASFDQFQNYGHRGRVFKELVSKIEGSR